jgi:hypothetical protein
MAFEEDRFEALALHAAPRVTGLPPNDPA